MANLLLIRGATLTLISTEMYDKLPSFDKPDLDVVATRVKSACGNELKLKGKGNFNLGLGEKMFTTNAVVAHLQVDGILGLDFMRSHNGVVDVGKEFLHVGEYKVKVYFQGTIGGYRVVASETVAKPSRSDVVINDKTCLDKDKKLSTEVAFKEANEKVGKQHILTARSLVKSDKDVPVRSTDTHIGMVTNDPNDPGSTVGPKIARR